jgi:hypothetical protein
LNGQQNGDASLSCTKRCTNRMASTPGDVLGVYWAGAFWPTKREQNLHFRGI